MAAIVALRQQLARTTPAALGASLGERPEDAEVLRDTLDALQRIRRQMAGAKSRKARRPRRRETP
jgi:hypothetical protein